MEDDKTIRFDGRTRDKIAALFQQYASIESQIRMICDVYLGAKGIDSGKENFQLLPDNSGLMPVPKGKDKKNSSKRKK